MAQSPTTAARNAAAVQRAPAPPPAAVPTDGRNLRALLTREEAKRRILPHLPGRTPAEKNEAFDRLTTIVDREGRRNPEIKECTGTSILDAVAQIVTWGLEIGSGAYLVPFNVKVSKRGEPDAWEKRCTPIMGYQGMAQTLIASKVVRAVEPYMVYEKEIERGDFHLDAGTDARIVHVPHWKGSDRGKPVLAYLVFQLPNNRTTFRAMSMEDIDAIRRQHSKKWKEGPCPPWWAFKCVMRQASKFLATTPELQRAFAPIAEEEQLELAAGGSDVIADALGSPVDAERALLRPGMVDATEMGAPSGSAEREPGEEEEEYQNDSDLDDSGYGR
jgi:phage RecT family recombinase